jgi:hypothetical protein
MEALYYCPDDDSIILVTLFQGKALFRNGIVLYNLTISIESATTYLIDFNYQLIGYV